MIKAKKSLGQHFLMHAQTAARIADAAHISKRDVVLEIGPGTGKLTRELLTRSKKVIAVETDRELHDQLQDLFADEIRNAKLELIFADVRTLNFKALPTKYSLVANIPYYITGDLFRMFLSAKKQPQQMTLLVQREVAERIARAKKESLLSLSVKAYGNPHYAFTVPRGAFVPAPKVDSAVLTISAISRKNFTKVSEEKFFTLIRAAFAHKRKQLKGNLAKIMPREDVEEAFLKLKISKNARAEDLSLDTWLKLARFYTH